MSRKSEKLDVLEKKAKIDKLQSLTEYTKVLDVLKSRQNSMQKMISTIAQLEVDIIALNKEFNEYALYSGSGRVVQKIIDKRKKLEKLLSIAKSKRDGLALDLKQAEDRFEIVRRSYAESQFKTNAIAERGNSYKISESESAAYNEEIQMQDIISSSGISKKYSTKK